MTDVIERLVDAGICVMPFDWVRNDLLSHWSASSELGEYIVWEIGNVGFWKPPSTDLAHMANGNAEVAKAAAHENYESRIVSALKISD